ncbi:ankyrin repeat domain-containing protein [Candidatus Dependentiae bacterium]|nr:ankyrin repeat domain-containing protein [Candidatus Dependentiae bacterium]
MDKQSDGVNYLTKLPDELKSKIMLHMVESYIPSATDEVGKQMSTTRYLAYSCKELYNIFMRNEDFNKRAHITLYNKMLRIVNTMLAVLDKSPLDDNEYNSEVLDTNTEFELEPYTSIEEETAEIELGVKACTAIAIGTPAAKAIFNSLFADRKAAYLFILNEVVRAHADKEEVQKQAAIYGIYDKNGILGKNDYYIKNCQYITAKFLQWTEGIYAKRCYANSPLLICAVGNKNKPLTTFLILMNTDITVQDQEGNTALTIIARDSEDKDIASLLIEKNIDINKANYQGFTALNYAVATSKFALAKLLIENGANYNNLPSESLEIGYPIETAFDFVARKSNQYPQENRWNELKDLMQSKNKDNNQWNELKDSRQSKNKDNKWSCIVQ